MKRFATLTAVVAAAILGTAGNVSGQCYVASGYYGDGYSQWDGQGNYSHHGTAARPAHRTSGKVSKHGNWTPQASYHYAGGANASWSGDHSGWSNSSARRGSSRAQNNMNAAYRDGRNYANTAYHDAQGYANQGYNQAVNYGQDAYGYAQNQWNQAGNYAENAYNNWDASGSGAFSGSYGADFGGFSSSGAGGFGF